MLTRIGFGFTLAFLAVQALAQAFPSKPIRIVVPGPPGSSLDVSGRELSLKVPELLGQPAVMEYRPGQGSGIGADYVAKSAPDGHTWLMAPYNVLTLNQHLYNNPVHPLKEFTPVTTVANVPFALVVHTSVPASNVREFLELARREPGKLNYGSSGAGSAQHLSAELLKSMAKINLTHVPYKGAANAITDLLGGRIQVYFGAVNSLLPHIKAGKIRALGTAGIKRSRVTADMPTIAESGVPGYQVATWNAVVLAGGTPPDIVAKIHAAVVQTLNTPEIRERLAGQGIEVETTSPQELAEHIRKEYDMHGKLVKEAGIKVE